MTLKKILIAEDEKPMSYALNLKLSSVIWFCPKKTVFLFYTSFALTG